MEGNNIKNDNILIAPHQLSIDITNKCNLRCLHCYNYSGENIQMCNELLDDEILNMVLEVSQVGLYNMCFCGGEPLLRKDLILKCIKILREHNVPNVSMVTNGLLLSKEVAKELKQSGITNVQLSIDGSNEETHDRLRNNKGAFKKVIGAIENLIDVGIKPGIAFTPTSFNIHQIKDLHNILRKYELFDISFRTQPLMLMGRATNNENSIRPSEKQYREFVKTINEINTSGLKPNIQWGDPIDHLIRFSTQDININQCIIRANGDIVVSQYLPLVVGNIRKYSFLEYWDKGLCNIWKYKIPKEISKFVRGIQDMNNDILPKLWKDEDIFIDLIENDLEDISIINKYI